MNKLLLALGLAATAASPAWALPLVSYNTTGSTLACNGVAGCVQNTSTSVTLSGLTLTYNAGSGSGVDTPSYINLGNLVTTGTGTNVNITGLRLSVNVNSTPPGASGQLPFGLFSGTLGTNSSLATLSFSSGLINTSFGNLPGTTISGGSGSFVYQIVNTSLVIQAPTVGNPLGQTSLQGAVSVSVVPEPSSALLLGLGLVAGLGWRRVRPIAR